MPFPEKFTTHYASKFATRNCPLRKQVEFSTKENIKQSGFSKDPVGDKEAEIENGILQKYKGRLLVLTSGACAIHCRFCFRRNIKHKKPECLPQRLAKILAKDKTIKEVILSGGDPLTLNDNELQAILDSIPTHIRIRIHSRMPIAKPSRFTAHLWNMFERLNSRLVFVSHINHPRELDKESEKIFQRMEKCGATLLNQSVLLKNVNDNAKILAELSEKLFSQRVLPYYLHQLDRAQGTAHFEVPLKEAKAIFNKLKELLPGYLVPRFVKEINGENSKTWIECGLQRT